LQYHPKALWGLAFGQMWNTFSYFGTQTILVLYFINIFQLGLSSSYTLYGAYAAFAYSTPILGGILADRWIGAKQTLAVGCLLNILGNLMMVSFDRYLFCLGLATSLIGAGFYKSNATSLVGALYQNGNMKKESGFTWFYLAMNVGGALGPLVYGFIAYMFGWNYAFLFSALGILVGSFWFIKNWSLLTPYCKPVNATKACWLFLYATMGLLCFVLSLAFYYPDAIATVVLGVFSIGLLYLLVVIFQSSSRERLHLFSLLLLCFISMFYFSAGLQTGAMITLFIQHQIQVGVVKTSLPGSTFNTLYCAFVLILAPCFSYLWRKLKNKGVMISVPGKVAMGVGLAALGMGVFAFAAMTKFVLLSVVIGYLLLSAGELVLTPAAYTAISDLAPTGLKSTMMGGWLLFIAIGSYFSSILANASHFVVSHLPFHIEAFLGEFAFIATFTLMIALLVSALVPHIRRMME